MGLHQTGLTVRESPLMPDLHCSCFTIENLIIVRPKRGCGIGQYHNDAKDIFLFSDMFVFASLSQLPTAHCIIQVYHTFSA